MITYLHTEGGAGRSNHKKRTYEGEGGGVRGGGIYIYIYRGIGG